MDIHEEAKVLMRIFWLAKQKSAKKLLQENLNSLREFLMKTPLQKTLVYQSILYHTPQDTFALQKTRGYYDALFSLPRQANSIGKMLVNHPLTKAIHTHIEDGKARHRILFRTLKNWLFPDRFQTLELIKEEGVLSLHVAQSIRNPTKIFKYVLKAEGRTVVIIRGYLHSEKFFYLQRFINPLQNSRWLNKKNPEHKQKRYQWIGWAFSWMETDLANKGVTHITIMSIPKLKKLAFRYGFKQTAFKQKMSLFNLFYFVKRIGQPLVVQN